jgi:hypothetical protein
MASLEARDEAVVAHTGLAGLIFAFQRFIVVAIAVA